MLKTTEPESLEEDRHRTVLEALLAAGARSVLDLGCGEGLLLARMLDQPQFERIVGMDRSAAALACARLRASQNDTRLTLIHGSFAEANERLQDFDAAIMVETIEHVDPRELSAVEQAVFGCYRPKLVLLTTPNAEYNVLYGMAPGEFRDPDHRFEWSRAKFKRWARGVAARNGYRVRFGEIGEVHPIRGRETHLAKFYRA
jgi:3' terminal RNA ribose 2'-O-methyltransferase Hen1